MNRLLSFAFLAAGIVLIIYGIAASDSIGSSFSHFFTGAPTNKTVWLLVGGVVAAIIGLGGVVTSSKSP